MVIIYSASWCGPCINAKKLLDSKKVNYKEINIEEANITRGELQKLTGGATVPQIVINKNNIYHVICYGEIDKIHQQLAPWVTHSVDNNNVSPSTIEFGDESY